MPRKYIPPSISTPVPWKYVHNRWNMHNSVLCAESTWIEQAPSLQDFSLRLIIPPESKHGPENKYLFRR